MSESKRYRVRTTREGRWWAIEFPDVDARIHSQARRLEQVPVMAAEAIGFALDIEVDAADIDVRLELDDEMDRVVGEARRLRHRADAAAVEAQSSIRLAVKSGLAHDLPMRDIGELLGVSFQYVSQLAKQVQ